MNDEIQELYQEIIIDHNRRPRNFGKLEEPAKKLDGYNPVCGDKLELSLRIEGDNISDVRFCGDGCAISVASASLMTEAVKGHSIAEAKATMAGVIDMIVGNGDVVASGKLAVLRGVRDFPGRVKCATLAWHTLESLIDGGGEIVTTE
ncbi:MAG: Fe-S cluster assembly sulfur transfer protein SufU [Candidatus Porifericomitaceae bacterium WSBS_2022_MAG_OTU9]